MDAFMGKLLFRTLPTECHHEQHPRIRTRRFYGKKAEKAHPSHDLVGTTESIRGHRKLRLVGALQRNAPLSCGNAP